MSTISVRSLRQPTLRARRSSSRRLQLRISHLEVQGIQKSFKKAFSTSFHCSKAAFLLFLIDRVAISLPFCKIKFAIAFEPLRTCQHRLKLFDLKDLRRFGEVAKRSFRAPPSPLSNEASLR